MSIPKKHHFLPECYLTPFTDSKRKFWKKVNGRSKLYHVTPGQVGYEIDSNKIRTKNPILFENISDEYFIEKEAFKKQENNYGQVIKSITKYLTTPQLIEKTKYHLFLETLVTIKRRNPVSRQSIISAFRSSINQPDYVSQFRSFLKEEIGEENMPENVDRYIQNYLETEARNPDRLYDMYLSAYLNQKEYTTIAHLTSDLYSLRQYILHSPIGVQFVTSDNPGLTVVRDQILSLGGFGDNFTFYFPLSPTSCLMLKSTHKEESSVLEKTIYPTLIEKHDVSKVNSFTKQVSDKYLLALDKNALK